MSARRRGWFLALPVLAAGLTGGVARAAEASNAADDVQCLLALTQSIDQSVDPDFKAAALTISAYYIGRIEGRDPNFDLTSALVAQSANQPLPALLRKRVVACAADYTARARQISDAGSEMKRRAK